jgi:threonine aldolase
MRQSGIIAAGGLYALHHMYDRLAEDHAMAAAIGDGLAAAGFDVTPVDTNIVLWNAPVRGGAAAFCDACAADGVLLCPIGDDVVRAIPHYGNDPAVAPARALAVFRDVRRRLLRS